MIRRLVLLVTAIAVLIGGAVVAFGFWAVSDDDARPDWTRAAPPPDALVKRPQGGVARVVVLTPPEYVDEGEGGKTLRQLTLPALFVAYPDGTWRASLVEPGSDGATADGLRVFFRLRPVTWTDNTAVDADDLRRTADESFVKTVHDPTPDGVIHVDLKQKYPDWRRLWSEGIEPPAPGVNAGPFTPIEVTSGLETVLRRNSNWFPENQPHLDEVRLVLAADAVQARLLLRNGQVDVYRAIDDTVRTKQLSATQGTKVAVEERSGMHVGLRLDNGDLSVDHRRRLSAQLPRSMFVGSLLNNEALLSNGLSGSGAWGESFSTPGSLSGANVGFASPPELPLTPLLAATLARTVNGAGGVFEPSGQPDVILDRRQDGPRVCWTCRFGLAEPELAAAADAGDEAAAKRLQENLRDQARFLPLWKPKEVVAWREGSVNGVAPNGFAYGNAWQAERWYRAG